MLRTNDVRSALESKISALETQVSANAAEDKSVGKLKRQARALKVIYGLINQYVTEDEMELGDNLETELTQMIDCKKGKSVTLIVHEGDLLGDLLEKYGNIKDVYHKLQKRCEELGLKIVLDHIERA